MSQTPATAAASPQITDAITALVHIVAGLSSSIHTLAESMRHMEAQWQIQARQYQEQM